MNIKVSDLRARAACVMAAAACARVLHGLPAPRGLIFATAAMAVLISPGTAATTFVASKDAKAPLLQVEVGMHVGPIQQMRIDRLRNRLITVSIDRTARIWQLPTLRLLHTIHVPATVGVEGQLAALAVSPDGNWLALGGITGGTWKGSYCIYLYTLADARLQRALCGYADIVQTLGFSSDGQQLAIGLGGTQGLRILRTSDWREIYRDTEYGNTVVYAEYSSRGLLATTSSDGYVRLYAAVPQLIGRRRISESTLLGGVRFAPDGATLAVGVVDRREAVLIDATTLNDLARLTVNDADVRGLCCVGFSADGRSLYLNGKFDGPGPTPLYRFSEGGRGAYSTLRLGDQAFTNMAPLPDGSLAFATEAPAVGLVDPQGRLQTLVRAATGDFRDGADAFAATEDGTWVRVPMAQGGRTALAFSLARAAAGGFDSGIDAPVPSGQAVYPAIRTIVGHRVDGLRDSLEPTLDGRRLRIDDNERVHAHAYAHAHAREGNALVLGTAWAVRRYDLDGTLRWRVDMSAAARNVLVTADRRFVIATVADGTVRWFDFATGQERLALYLHTNRKDWVLWRPDGYYTSSDDGDRFVGWLQSEGVDHEPDFFRAVQFERLFYRPDLLLATVRGEPHTGLPVRARTTAGEAPTIERLRDIAPPRVRVSAVSMQPQSDGTTRAILRIEAQRLAAPMGELVVYVNGLPVTPGARRSVAPSEADALQREVTVTLDAPENDIRVEVSGAAPGRLAATEPRSMTPTGSGAVRTSDEPAVTANTTQTRRTVINAVGARGMPLSASLQGASRGEAALGLAELWLPGPSRPATRRRGNLYVVAVGVNTFKYMAKPAWPGDDLTLGAASSDARAFAAGVQRAASRLHDQVFVHLLNEDEASRKPDKATVLQALHSVREAGPDDTVIVFLASHGFSDRQGNYYFLPRDAKPADLIGVLEGSITTGLAATLLSWTEIFDALRQAAGRRLLVVDTCQARNIAGEGNRHSLRKRSASSLFALMLASQGNESSQEWSAKGGVFTFGFLEALEGRAGTPAVVTLADAFEHARMVVATKRPLKDLPQTPELIAPAGLDQMPLASP